MSALVKPQVDVGEYQYGFRDEEDYVYKSKRGLNRKVVEEISAMKDEPDWMRDFRLKALYHSLREDLEKQGVIFLDMDSGVREHPDLVKQYFGTIIPANDNKFAALNSAVWSGGSFIYVPENVRVEVPLQAYFRINAENMGQFERTLIICAPGSYVHYVEGCTAPTYSTDSLHSAVVEIIVQEGARCRYTTIQNWSKNVYNLVTKRAM